MAVVKISSVNAFAVHAKQIDEANINAEESDLCSRKTICATSLIIIKSGVI